MIGTEMCKTHSHVTTVRTTESTKKTCNILLEVWYWWIQSWRKTWIPNHMSMDPNDREPEDVTFTSVIDNRTWAHNTLFLSWRNSLENFLEKMFLVHMWASSNGNSVGSSMINQDEQNCLHIGYSLSHQVILCLGTSTFRTSRTISNIRKLKLKSRNSIK